MTAPQWAQWVERLSEERLTDLARTEELGVALDFSQAVPMVRMVRRWIEALTPEDMEAMPAPQVSVGVDQLNALENAIASMMAFDPATAGNPASERQTWI